MLSGGEQQRVALARAIVPRPAVMLMDEPFSGLDVQLRETMQEETLALLRETRATCMIVTHDPEEAMRLGDRIAVMRAGRIVQAGKAEELYRHPADLFVARLFSRDQRDAGYRVERGRLRHAGRDLRGARARRGQPRHPVHPRSAPSAVAPAATGLPGACSRQVPRRCRPSRDRRRGLRQAAGARVRESDGWARRAEVGIEIDPARVLVFPAESEN